MKEEKNKDGIGWRDLIPEELEDFLGLSFKDKCRVGRFCGILILLMVNEDLFSLFSACMLIYLIYAGYGLTKTSIYKKFISNNRIDKEMNTMDKESLRGLFEDSVLNEPQVVIAQSGSKVVYKEITSEKKEAPQVTDEQIVNAIEKCQTMFWAQSAWAVFFCVCRDYLCMKYNMTETEHYIKGLPFTRELAFECPEGTIQKAVANNPYMKLPIDKWKLNGAKNRAVLLAEKLITELNVE